MTSLVQFKFSDVEQVQYNHVKQNLTFVYHFTCLNMHLDNSFVSKLFLYHKGDVRFLIKEDLFGYIIKLCNQFKHFAFSLEEFLNLSKIDQTKLLHQNTPIYVQLILSMYFNGKTGFDQLSCLPGVEPQITDFLARIGLEQMSQQLGLFHPTFNLHQYDMTMKTSILPVKLQIQF